MKITKSALAVVLALASALSTSSVYAFGGGPGGPGGDQKHDGGGQPQGGGPQGGGDQRPQGPQGGDDHGPQGGGDRHDDRGDHRGGRPDPQINDAGAAIAGAVAVGALIGLAADNNAANQQLQTDELRTEANQYLVDGTVGPNLSQAAISVGVDPSNSQMMAQYASSIANQ